MTTPEALVLVATTEALALVNGDGDDGDQNGWTAPTEKPRG